FDLPERRIPVIILISGVPFSPIILSRYFLLVFIFILSPLSKIIFFYFFETILLCLLYVSAKYSCGFPDPQVLPIIVVERYLDYFTTIMEGRLWQVLAKPVFRWRNRYGLSMNAARAA